MILWPLHQEKRKFLQRRYGTFRHEIYLRRTPLRSIMSCNYKLAGIQETWTGLVVIFIEYGSLPHDNCDSPHVVEVHIPCASRMFGNRPRSSERPNPDTVLSGLIRESSLFLLKNSPLFLCARVFSEEQISSTFSTRPGR